MKSLFRIFFLSVMVLAAAFPAKAEQSVPEESEGWNIQVGLAGAYASSPYKGHDDDYLPFPIISYEGERFFVRGASAGLHVWKDEFQELSVGVSYDGTHFDNGKTDDKRLKKLKDRHSTMTVDLRYALRTAYGHGGITLSQDVLGNSEGLVLDARYKYPLEFGALTVSPGLGLRWESEKQIRYYYGVSSREARRSGLEKYRPGNGVSPYLSLEAGYGFAESWSVMAGGRLIFLSDKIQDSPMVDDSKQLEAYCGISYSF